jgi:REP element-mobilizing transposase RayT
MPRAPRIEFAGATYHVTSRGNARQRIFISDNDRVQFLDYLGEAIKTFDVALLAYVLMDNHYHLLVRTRRANLSRFMQQLNTRYALYVRFKRGRPGHLLQGRYAAKLVEDGAYLADVTRYMHLNPVKTQRGTRLKAKQRYRLLEAYPWSSYRAYVGSPSSLPLCWDALDEYGGTSATARKRYGKYVEALVTEDDEILKEAFRLNPYAMGSEAFVAKVADELKHRRSGGPADQDVALPREKPVTLDQVDRVVSRICVVDEGLLKQHGHRAGLAKVLAVELASRLSAETMRVIGAHYGMGAPAVAMLRLRWRGRLQGDRGVRKLLRAAERELIESE